MICRLSRDELTRAMPLFEELTKLQLSAGAVLEGDSDGLALVDDSEQPRSGVVMSPEGTYFAGDPDNRAFNEAIREYLWTELYGRQGLEMIFVTVDRTEWEPRIAQIAHPRRVLTIGRRHYVCRSLRSDWRAEVPDGFDVVRLSPGVLADPANVFPDHLWGWIESNWGTRERFLDRGLGCVTLCDRCVVSWCIADCRCGSACEIGIQTLPEYRRRGLATVTAAAAVEQALETGFELVGWHCNEDNSGSIGTAEKVGFELERKYESLYAYATEADELAEMGWVAFRSGRYRETVELYERVFELQPDAPDYKYHLAALAWSAVGDAENALRNLNLAIERGWCASEFSAAQTEFEPLHGDPRWADMLDRMRRARAGDS